jgi:hypothetical protein
MRRKEEAILCPLIRVANYPRLSSSGKEIVNACTEAVPATGTYAGKTSMLQQKRYGVAQALRRMNSPEVAGNELIAGEMGINGEKGIEIEILDPHWTRDIVLMKTVRGGKETEGIEKEKEFMLVTVEIGGVSGRGIKRGIAEGRVQYEVWMEGGILLIDYMAFYPWS